MKSFPSNYGLYTSQRADVLDGIIVGFIVLVLPAATPITGIMRMVLWMVVARSDCLTQTIAEWVAAKS